AVVDRAVAVVVEAVAGLRGRLRVLVAGDLPRRARRGARAAAAELAGAAARAAAGVAVVDHAVAVVVDAVAGLRARLRVLVADDGDALAHGRARRADALEPGVAEEAAAGVAVVDRAVAVVVGAVAGLRGGLHVLQADDGA